nr:DUF433 domain-containing protein [Olivibacter sitiensis]
MEVKQQELLSRITIKPGLMGGRPTVRGLRFPVSDIWNYWQVASRRPKYWNNTLFWNVRIF